VFWCSSEPRHTSFTRSVSRPRRVAVSLLFYCISDMQLLSLLVVNCVVAVVDFCCAMLSSSAAFAIMQCPSVCLCVCLSHSWIVSKRIKICSKFFHHRVAKSFWLVFHTKRDGNIPTGTPLTGASNAGGVGRNRDSEPVAGSTACCECEVQYLSRDRLSELTTLVAGEWQSLFLTGDDDEVYDKKPHCCAEDNRAAFNCTQW